MPFLITTTESSSPGDPSLLFAIWLLVLGGFFFYLLVRATKKRGEEDHVGSKARLGDEVAEARSRELEWYREKRFLMERQAREKRDRLLSLVESFDPDRQHRLTHAASRLFFLAESLREERQFLGTDISKLSLIDRRLRSFGKDCVSPSSEGVATFLSELSQCRHMIERNREDLRKSQNLLRHVLADVVELEEKACDGEISARQIPAAIDALHDIEDILSDLPEGLRNVARITGERAETLFQEFIIHVPDAVLHPVWREQLSLDLVSSKHRAGGREELLEAIRSAINAFQYGGETDGEDPLKGTVSRSGSRKNKALKKKSKDSGKTGTGPWSRGDKSLEVKQKKSEGESPAYDTRANEMEGDERRGRETDSGERKEKKEVKTVGLGDAVWASPINFGAGETPTTKKFKFNPFSSKEGRGEIGNVANGPNRTVIFRSDNPEIWNSNTDRGEADRAVDLEDLSVPLKWIGIRRLDSGEEVFSKLSPEEITANGDGKAAGFNGSNEYFYGARHLGLFSEACVPEVETRFTYGGWGFGHLSSASEEEEGNAQVCGWNGKEIPGGTVFEFAIYRELPEGVDQDQVIS